MTRRSESGSVELLEGFPPPVPVLDRWRALAVRRQSAFATPEWSRAWFTANQAERPFVLIWHDDGHGIRGMLPLASVREGRATILRSPGAEVADWFTPVCDPADDVELAERCAAALSKLNSEWSRLSLDRVVDDSPWPAALVRRWPRAGAAAIPRRQPQPLPFVELGEDGFAGYMAGRSRNFRSQVGRRRRKLERDHGLRLRLTADSDTLEADLDVFVRLHRARWADRGGGALSPATEALHRLFAREALRAGWLRLWIMELDGEPAGAWYGWSLGGRYQYYLSGFEPSYARLGVGTVMLAHTIEAAAAEGATVYDLLAGDEPYKRRFETGRRQVDSYVVARRLTPSWAAAATGLPLMAAARSARSLLRGASAQRGEPA